MAIFATVVSLRNWVGGEIVQARGKPRETKTVRWVFLKERTMKPHHKLFFPFVSARVGFFQHGFCRVNWMFLSFFFGGAHKCGSLLQKTRRETNKQKLCLGNDFRAGNMHFLISAANFWGEIVLNSLTFAQAPRPYPKYNTRSINVFWGSQILTYVMRTPAILLLLPDICLPLAVDHWGCIYIYIYVYTYNIFSI